MAYAPSAAFTGLFKINTGSSGSPTWTLVNGMIMLPAYSLIKTTIDATPIDAAPTVLNLLAGGTQPTEFQIEYFESLADAGQAAIYTAFGSGASTMFQETGANTVVTSFTAVVQGWARQPAGRADALKIQVKLLLQGALTRV